jgi:hypothetical protein
MIAITIRHPIKEIPEIEEAIKVAVWTFIL